jgi:predicted nucleic acid-binding protein
VFSALLDTCVLWPNLQRDFLLAMAIEGLYRPLWSEAILAELSYTERAKLERRGVRDAGARAARLIAHMRRAFDDALVTGWEPLVGTYGFPDPDDEHVIAAAVVGGAGAIVTSDKAFRRFELPNSIDALTPAEFAFNTVQLNPIAAGRAVREIAARGRRTPHQLVEQLETKYGMTDAAAILREHLG